MPEPRRRRTAFAATVLRTERLSAVARPPGRGRSRAGPVHALGVHRLLRQGRCSCTRTRRGRCCAPRTAGSTSTASATPDGPSRRRAPRTYTVRAFDEPPRELTLDFVVHGDEGLAGPWAVAAQPGDQIAFMGPGGGYAPDPAGGLAPARRRRERPAGDRGRAGAPAGGRRGDTPSSRCTTRPTRSTLTGPAGVEVHLAAPGDARPRRAGWWRRSGRDVAPATTCTRSSTARPRSVKELRRYLRVERALGLDRLSISGYWRLGVDDEGWRASKKEWNAAIEESEAVVA